MVYYIYFRNSKGEFRMLNSETKEIDDATYSTYYERTPKFFTITTAGFEPTDEGLLEYQKKFESWCSELQKNDILKIEFKKYFNMDSAATLTFKRLCKGKYEHHNPISRTERTWMDKCYNGGLMYGERIETESHGYDYSFFYPKILASKNLFIPTCEGKEVTLDELPKDLKTGYYHVKIVCQNINFKKLFAFSEDHVYTDRSLYQALKHQKEFKVEISLFDDGKPNAYTYDTVERADQIFGNWYRKISALKEKFPKNPLVKWLGSSLWGHICKKQTIYMKESELKDLDVGITDKHRFIIVGEHFTKKGDNYYELIDTEKKSDFNIRLMPFLTAYARNKTARVCLGNINYGVNKDKNVTHNLSDVIRIHTDGIVFKTIQTDLEGNLIKDLKVEDKTTGHIKWTSVNKYKKI